MPKLRQKHRMPISNKQWIQYGVVVVFIGGGLYLNFSGGRNQDNDLDTSPAELVYVPSIPVAENADEEPSDGSLMPPVYDEEDIAELQESDLVGDAPRRRSVPEGASLDEYNPTRLWLDPPSDEDAHSEEEWGELGTYHAESLYDNDDEPVHEEAPTSALDVADAEETPLTTEPDTNVANASSATPLPTRPTLEESAFDSDDSTTEQPSANREDDLSPDIERLAQSRNRIEQQVRRGQIPPSQRDEILRSEDFNAVIAGIGRRVGEAWYYDGDDHADHGAILSIELGHDGSANDIRIRRSSGHQPYNDSVLDAAQRSAPFAEVATLSSTAQTLLNPFSLTFGSMEAIEAYEATWERQAPINAPNDDGDDENSSIEHQAVTVIKREMRNHWPSNVQTGVDHDVSLQVTLAIPLGSVASVDFLRASNSVDLNDRIYQLVRNMPAFTSVRDLSLQEQQAVRQFNLHITPNGTLR